MKPIKLIQKISFIKNVQHMDWLLFIPTKNEVNLFITVVFVCLKDKKQEGLLLKNHLLKALVENVLIVLKQILMF